ncbi:MAG: hypothetical protein ACOX5R_01215 [bacterium]
MADVKLGRIPGDGSGDHLTDGWGALIEADPGEGIIVLVPVQSATQPVLIQCAIRTDSPGGVFSLAAFGETHQFQSTHQVQDRGQFQQNYTLFSHVIIPSEQSFRPFLQFVNSHSSTRITAFIDNLRLSLLNSELSDDELAARDLPALGTAPVEQQQYYPSAERYYFLFLVDLFILLCSSWCLSRLFPFQAISLQILLVWLILTALISLTAYCLSFLHVLNLIPAWLALHFLIFLLSGALFYFYGRPPAAVHLSNPLNGDMGFSWCTTILIATLLSCAVVWIINMTLPLHFAEFDAFGYHLPRAHYYLQQSSLEAFFTTDIRQITFPVIAEIQYMWILLFTKSVRLILLLQWIWVFLSVTAIFSACRLAGVERRYSCLTALLWLCTPDVLWHVSWIKNDLLTASFSITALVFVLSLSQYGLYAGTALALALGLAVGTKYTSLFLCAGVLVAVIILLLQKKLTLKQTGILLLLIAASIVLLGSYTYIDAWVKDIRVEEAFPASYNSLRLDHLSVNLLRLLGELTDSFATLFRVLSSILPVSLPDPRAPLFQALASIPFLNVYASTGFWALAGDGVRYQLGTNFLGISFAVVVLVFMGFYCLWRERNRILLPMVWGSVIALFLALAILSWQPRPMIRIFLPMLILFFPLCGLTLRRMWSRSVVLRWFTGIVTVLSVIYTMYYYAHLLNNYYDADPYRFNYNLYTDSDTGSELKTFLEIQLGMQEFLQQYLAPTEAIAVESGFALEAMHLGDHFERPVYLLPQKTTPQQVRQIFLEHPDIQAIFIPTTELDRFSEFDLRPVRHYMVAILRN